MIKKSDWHAGNIQTGFSALVQWANLVLPYHMRKDGNEIIFERSSSYDVRLFFFLNLNLEQPLNSIEQNVIFLYNPSAIQEKKQN